MPTEYLLLVPVSLFAIVGPVSASAVFLAMTPENTEVERIRTARLACLVATGVLFFFAISGELLFKAIGITVPAFQVAGGLLLFTIAMDLLRAQESPTKLTAEEKHEGANKEEIAVTPLGVPLLAGPGAISTVILLNNRADYWYEKLYLYFCISAVMFVSFLILQVAAKGARRLSPLFLKVSNRLMGLLLAAIAVQFVFNGIKSAEW
jgi:multiple antibiotic resistance protein